MNINLLESAHVGMSQKTEGWGSVAFAMLRDLSTEVATMNSLWLSVAVALTMAAVVAVASPFVQPEMDALQCLCFCCS